ncbi:MAG: peptidylprolyl isomerase [Alphaproteobacteria bacterium CG_4_10_14_0_8_um_filter_37_21]|nr:MAG: peptidylprolyl isomerase [Alphaproteobacteria bacterium CG_4_10_14_0_8_um_filter_37_21]
MEENMKQIQIFSLAQTASALTLLALLTSCEKKGPEPIKEEKSIKIESKKMEFEKIDTAEGSGKVAKKKDTLLMHYTGRLEDGTKFDSSHDRGQPLQFDLGIGQVIKGWDEGIEGMKVGGKRTLKIPSEMGYGARGAGTVIPPHANLIFDIELVDVIS